MILLRRRTKTITIDIETENLININGKVEYYKGRMAELSHNTPNMTVHEFIRKNMKDCKHYYISYNHGITICRKCGDNNIIYYNVI